MFISALPGTAGVWLRKGDVGGAGLYEATSMCSIAGAPSLTGPLLMSGRESMNSKRELLAIDDAGPGS
jgi:hypothetical protein